MYPVLRSEGASTRKSTVGLLLVVVMFFAIQGTNLADQVPLTLPSSGDKAQAKAAAAAGNDVTAFAALQKFNLDANKNAVQVIESYRQFLKDRPAVQAEPGVRVYLEMIDLQGQLHDTKGWLESFEGLANRYPNSSKLPGMLLQAGEMYLADKQPAKAGEVLRRYKLDNSAPISVVAGYLVSYTQALTGQDKDDKRQDLIRVCTDLLSKRPVLLGMTDSSPFKALIDALIKAQRAPEAQQWAKLRFIACDFETAAINDSCSLSIQAWVAQDLSLDRAQMFKVALEDGSRANPLRSVALPEAFRSLDRPGRDSRLSDKSPHDAITLLLVAGAYRKAMDEAKKLLLTETTTQAGVLEVCRVLKAKNLNLVQANAFIQYAKTGAGSNPLANFYQETAPAPATAPQFSSAISPAKPAGRGVAVGKHRATGK